MRIFLAFFGITRSLRFTADSIARNVIRPILTAGLDLRTVGHFHVPAMILNPRSGEFALPTDPEEAALLDLDRCATEPQSDTLIADSLALCRAYPDHYGDGYRSARNLCFQLRSLDAAWSLLAPDLGADDWVFFLRPDLLYLDPIDTAGLITTLTASNLDMAVPAWHAWGGVNDRFALCNARAAQVYATRGRALARALPQLGALHAESLLAHKAVQAKLRIGTIGHRAVRIRANGRAAVQDVQEFGLAWSCCPQARQPALVTAVGA